MLSENYFEGIASTFGKLHVGNRKRLVRILCDMGSIFVHRISNSKRILYEFMEKVRLYEILSNEFFKTQIFCYFRLEDMRGIIGFYEGFYMSLHNIEILFEVVIAHLGLRMTLTAKSFEGRRV